MIFLGDKVEILKLSNETIDMLSAKIGEMYSELECTKKETMRARLILEEALIKYQKRFGEEAELYFKIYRVFSQTRFLVRLRTPSFDPFTLEENPMAFMIESVMSAFEGSMPSWKYRNLENEIVFSVRKKAKISGVLKIVVATIVSVVLAFLSKFCFSAKALNGFVNNYVSPLSNAYAELFCVMAVLLTFFAIVLSVVHIGDMAVVGKIGGKIMRKFYSMSTILVVILTLFTLPFYKIGGSGDMSFVAKSVYDIIIDFIPGNIVKPFIDFNSIHIMIIGAMFGFSLLYMGQKGENLTRVFDECNLVSVYTNDFLNKFISIYVGLKVYELIITSNLSTLSVAGKAVGFIICGQILLLAFYSVYVCVKTKVSFKRFVKAAMPSFFVSLSSANFGASMITAVDGLTELDALNDKSNLAFNIGSVVFRPACTLVFVFSSLAFASTYGVEISVVWIIMAIVLSILLIAAVPNVPGVSVSVITLLFVQLGLPNDAVRLMIAVNAPLQFLTVAVDTYCLFAESYCLSYINGKKKYKLK